jgi:hypothetical protein
MPVEVNRKKNRIFIKGVSGSTYVRVDDLAPLISRLVAVQGGREATQAEADAFAAFNQAAAINDFKHLQRLSEENRDMFALLQRCRQREHNPFEPDNQTRLYKDIGDMLDRIAQ